MSAPRRPQRLRDLPNLGPKSEPVLAQVGITTVAQLRAADPFAVYAQLMQLPDAQGYGMNMLYALIGAIEDRHWLDVARTRRTDILLRLDAMGLAPKGRRS